MHVFLVELSIVTCNPFPNDKFYSSELERFADDSFKFDENGGEFFK